MEHPLERPITAQLPLQPVPAAPLSAPPVQPPLAGLDLATEPVARRAAVGRSARARGRRRYWSIRDLSRRLWLGRGYDLLRDLIRSGILPATRSAHSWWIDDADVHSLRLAFDERAGKVRAFRNLDGWLRERCQVVPAHSPTVDAGERPSAFHWRGVTYLPREAWPAEQTPTGPVAAQPGAPEAPVTVVPEAAEAEAASRAA